MSVNNIVPLYVHLSDADNALLEQMQKATKQSKAKLIGEAVRLLSTKDLSPITKPEKPKTEPKSPTSWIVSNR